MVIYTTFQKLHLVVFQDWDSHFACVYMFNRSFYFHIHSCRGMRGSWFWCSQAVLLCFWLAALDRGGGTSSVGYFQNFQKSHQVYQNLKTEQGNRYSNYVEIMEGTPNCHKG